MKIPLVIRLNHGHLAAYAFTSIRKIRLRPAKIYGLIDTGAPWTTLMPSGADILKIPKKFLSSPSTYKTISLAGYTFNRYLLKNVNFMLKDEKSNLIHFPIKELSVLEPIKKIDLTRFPIQFLIGCDFFEDNNLGLYFNPSNNVAYLQR